MPDGNAVRVGDGDAHPAVLAGDGEGGKVAAQFWIKHTEPVPFAGAVGKAKQCGQRYVQVHQDWTSSLLALEGGRAWADCRRGGELPPGRGLAFAGTVLSPRLTG